jgi:hypothetical protein
MPDKRDVHQAKSHRNSKSKGQSAGQARGKARGQASVPGGSGTIAMEDTQVMPTMTGSAGGKNKSRR